MDIFLDRFVVVGCLQWQRKLICKRLSGGFLRLTGPQTTIATNPLDDDDDVVGCVGRSKTATVAACHRYRNEEK